MPQPSTITIWAVGLSGAVAAAVSLSRRRARKVGGALPRKKGCIYLDVAATCPIYPEVADAMLPFLYEHWGNPSSGHAYPKPRRNLPCRGGPTSTAAAAAEYPRRGRGAAATRLFAEYLHAIPSRRYGAPCRDAVATARRSLATLINAKDPDEIVFCSCGSEADNWAIVASLGGARDHVVVSAIEHPAILACANGAETSSGGADFATYFKRGAFAFQRCKNQQKWRSYDRDPVAGASTL